jgi:predicted O-methyltransferase YrrM
MDVARLLKDMVKRAVGYRAATVARDTANVNVTLAAAVSRVLSTPQSRTPRHVVEYVEILRECIELYSPSIRIVKNDSSPRSLADKRFSSILDAMRRVPPVPLGVAMDVALVADSFRDRHEEIETENWAGDVADHFAMSSSFGRKGRILQTVIRFARSDRCLELGTAYGMSSMFMLEALADRGDSGHVTTLEGGELQFALASAMLRQRYGDRVTCERGWTQDAVPRIVTSLDRIDFLFHDAAHGRDEYLRDFLAVAPHLGPGAVALFDDIRWNDPRFATNPRCYEGWMEIVNHPRVRRAVEIDGSMGLLMMGE